MGVLHPFILFAGLGAVSVPILIHLLMRRRRQPVMWGAMRFVLEAYKQTRRRMLIQRWLLLACRCLLVALIGVILARPLLGSAAGGVQGQRRVHLVIDNSIASQALETDGARVLDRHLRRAQALLGTLGAGDQVSLWLLGGPADGVIWPASSNLAAAGEVLKGVRATDSGADLQGALSAIARGVDPTLAAGSEAVVLLSDFPSGVLDVLVAAPKLPPGVRIVVSAPPAASTRTNIGVASVVPTRGVLVKGDSPGANTTTITLLRSGNLAPADTSLRIAAIDAPAASGLTTKVRWSAGQREASMTLPIDELRPVNAADDSSTLVLRASIDRDSLAGDDTFSLALASKAQLRVGLLGELRGARLEGDAFAPAQWIAAALRPSEAASIDLTDLDPAALDAAKLAGLDGVIVTTPNRLDDAGWARLRSFAVVGGVVLITPTAELESHAWTDAMTGAMELGWKIGRSPKDVKGEISPLAPTGDGPGGDLLGVVRREMEELARPVRVSRVLEVSEADPATVLLRMSSGEPLVIAARPGAGAATKPAASTPATTTVATNTTNSAKTSGTTATPGTATTAKATSRTASRGAVIFITTAFSSRWTDLPTKPLMVPLLQELVRQGVSRARPARTVTAGLGASLLEMPAGMAELRVLNAVAGEPATLSLDPATGRPASPLRRAAVLRAVDASGKELATITVNADAPAARQDPVDPAALRGWLASAIAVPSSPGTPPPEPIFLSDDTVTTLPATFVSKDINTALIASTVRGDANGPSWIWGLLFLAVGEVLLARWASAAPRMTVLSTSGEPTSDATAASGGGNA